MKPTITPLRQRQLEMTPAAHHGIPKEWPTMGMVCRFSLCRKYRFTLWRKWDIRKADLFASEDAGIANGERAKQYLQVIGLNPSTADESNDDPTIRRCIDFAHRWGFGGLCMTNLFGFRATDPEAMKVVDDPVGNENDHHLLEVAKGAGMVLAAWGNHGSHVNRAEKVREMLQQNGIRVHALRITKTGHPQHPLYIPADTQTFELPGPPLRC